MIISSFFGYDTVILSNGVFPQHSAALSFLQNASHIVCCDGAVDKLIDYGIEPDFIVGDLDSLSQELRQRYNQCLHLDTDQNCNDLTKAVNFCAKRDWNEITIVGATGKREDHSIGNISLLADYASYVKVQLITDFGVFVPILKSAQFKSYAGQQVSIFSLSPDTVFTFHGLKYPLCGQTITSWWQGTLNEALGDDFLIEMDHGRALVFREH